MTSDDVVGQYRNAVHGLKSVCIHDACLGRVTSIAEDSGLKGKSGVHAAADVPRCLQSVDREGLQSARDRYALA